MHFLLIKEVGGSMFPPETRYGLVVAKNLKEAAKKLGRKIKAGSSELLLTFEEEAMKVKKLMLRRLDEVADSKGIITMR